MINMPRSVKLLPTLIQAAIKAGDAVMDLYQQNCTIVAGDKQFPVTKADKVSHNILLAELAPLKCNVLSEEDLSFYEPGANAHVIIDPIDGTKDFVEQTGQFCIMIAYEEEQEILASVIYEPVAKTYYVAQKGLGAFQVDNKGTRLPLHVSQTTNTMLVSRFHRTSVEEHVATQLEIKEFLPHGSAGLKMVRVAQGKADMYIGPLPVGERRSGEWDSAAGSLILQEAGGVITDCDGNPLKFCQKTPKNMRGFVASNGHNHDLLISLIQSHL